MNSRWTFGNSLKCFIVGNKRRTILPSDLSELPEFLRINEVDLWYEYSRQSITEKCQLFVNYLQPLTPIINDANLIHFFAQIRQNYRNHCHFSGHSQLLDHIRKELLPNCTYSRGYLFEISFYSDMNSAADVIISLLQMHPIKQCPNVEIRLYELASLPIQLPVKTISQWLNRKCDGSNANSKERFLKIYSDNIRNAQELYDDLKKVIITFPI